MNKAKFFLLFLIISSIFSCESNEEYNTSDHLIGEWLRTDSREDFEFRLIFNTNNTGYKIVKNGTKETNITSSLISFDWNIVNDNLNLIELNEVFSTSISINNEQLILNDYSDFPFNRVE